MTNNKLVPGIYRLTKTLRNPHPDRRVKRDFSRLVYWEEGTLILVDETKHPNDQKDQTILRMWEKGGYSFHGFYETEEGFSEIAPHLERLEEKPSDWIERETVNQSLFAVRMLDLLWKNKLITMDDVKKFADEIEKED